MGAQADDKRVWFETASLKELFKYFGKLFFKIWFIGFACGIIASLIGFYTPWYTQTSNRIILLHTQNPGIIVLEFTFLFLAYIALTYKKGGKQKNEQTIKNR